jgi:hypothetical protein
MQTRIANILTQLDEGEELLSELLNINDEINNVLLRYGRFLKNTTPTQNNLIDFAESSEKDGAVPKKRKVSEMGGVC